MSQVTVDLDIVRTYSRPGPRYTSYPPATHFIQELSEDKLASFLERSNERASDLSLYFHLPFCWSLCWYCGCTTVITGEQSKSNIYLGYLDREIDLLSRLLDTSRRVAQIHLGGGTPTFLTPDELRMLGELIRSRFNVASDVEASVEVDPRRITRDHAKALREAGFTRASLGIQDNNPLVQRAVNRIQPFDLTTEVVGWLRGEGFRSINFDLIYGLPLQTPQTFAQTLDELTALDPDRFAVFSYAHVPWMKPAQKLFSDDDLPDTAMKLDLMKLTIEKLTAAGYEHIGLDHFVKPDDELAVARRNKTLQRNFQGYSTRGGTDIIGFGMSAISQTGDLYWQNVKELPEYYRMIESGKLPLERCYEPTDDDKIRRSVIMRIMCDLELDYDALSLELGIDFRNSFADELASLGDLEADGLIEYTARGFRLTETGQLLIRVIAMRFDAYLPKQEVELRYSKVI